MNLEWTKQIFEDGRKAIVSELKRLMTQQKGVDGQVYGKLAPSTIKQKMKVSTATADKRMIRTKDFMNNAYESRSLDGGVIVFIGSGVHGREYRTARKPATREKLLQKKTAKGVGSAETYVNIARWQLDSGQSKFFPGTTDEIMELQSVQQIKKRLATEGLKQMREQAGKALRAQVTLG